MLLHPSVTVMVNLRVCVHPLSESSTEQFLVKAPGQLSVATTNAFTVSQVGGLAGLQPKAPPVGQVVIVGLTVSCVQV